AHYGVDATDRDRVQMVVVKTASNFQYFGEWTSEVIRVDTPGHTQSRVTDFDWRRLPRPIFPLDADAALDFQCVTRRPLERPVRGRLRRMTPVRAEACQSTSAVIPIGSHRRSAHW